MAGAVDHACLRSGRLTEISSPTARQGRSGFDLFKAYTVSHVSVPVFQVKVALVIRDGAFKGDVQTVGYTLDFHVFQVSVRDQEGRAFPGPPSWFHQSIRGDPYRLQRCASMVVLISTQRGAVTTFEQVGGRAMILIQGIEERLPLRPLLQSR